MSRAAAGSWGPPDGITETLLIAIAAGVAIFGSVWICSRFVRARVAIHGKRLPRRIAGATGILSLGVTAALAMTHGESLQDHLQAWHFQLARRVDTIQPDPNRERTWDVNRGDEVVIRFRSEAEALRWTEATSRKDAREFLYPSSADVLNLLADCSRQPVIFAPPTRGSLDDSCPVLIECAKELRATEALQILRDNGWTVLEQRFPRRAYVAVRGEPVGDVTMKVYYHRAIACHLVRVEE